MCVIMAYRYEKCWKHTDHTSILQTGAAEWSEIEKRKTQKKPRVRACVLYSIVVGTPWIIKECLRATGKGLYVQKTSWTETPLLLLLQYYEIWDNFPRVKRDRNILRARGDKATREDSWIFLLFLFTYIFIRYSLTLISS